MSDTVVVMNNSEIQQIGSPTDIYNEPEKKLLCGKARGRVQYYKRIMIRDYLSSFDGFEFECVDKTLRIMKKSRLCFVLRT